MPWLLPVDVCMRLWCIQGGRLLVLCVGGSGARIVYKMQSGWNLPIHYYITFLGCPDSVTEFDMWLLYYDISKTGPSVLICQGFGSVELSLTFSPSVIYSSGMRGLFLKFYKIYGCIKKSVVLLRVKIYTPILFFTYKKSPSRSPFAAVKNIYGRYLNY